MKNFESLVGGEFDFYGVDNLNFKIGEHVFEVVEDESDGYRSYLGSIEVSSPDGLNFFNRPLARVRVEDSYGSDSNGWYQKFSGYQLTDVNSGHVWLLFGTNDTDDYYPCFTFYYDPDRNQEIKSQAEPTLAELVQAVRANFEKLLPLYDLATELDGVLEDLDASIRKIEAKSGA